MNPLGMENIFQRAKFTFFIWLAGAYIVKHVNVKTVKL